MRDYLLCVPIRWADIPHVPSKRDKCLDCKTSVWRARTSPRYPALCIPCILLRLEAGENMTLGELTRDQLEHIVAWHQEHDGLNN